MHYLISGLAKSGTTRLFTQVKNALSSPENQVGTFFEPWEDSQLSNVLQTEGDTLTKVLIGRVHADNSVIPGFDRHVMIYRDPRDQFVSSLLYLFYDFQTSGDHAGFERARTALRQKVEDPGNNSALDLYDELAKIVGRAPRGVFAKLHQVQDDFSRAFSPYRLAYEDLIDGAALQGLGDYLGLGIAEEADVDRDYSRVARSKNYGEWRSWLTLADQAWVCENWGEHLRSLGYSLEMVEEAPAINPELSLDYIAQFQPPNPLP